MSEQDSAQNCREQFENETPLIPFQPVPVRARHDGWTAERQIAFIEKLADCGSVTAAARHVGMSRESALERARNGVSRPIFHNGEQVGEWRHYDERLIMFLLRFRRRHRFGPEADDLPGDGTVFPGSDPDGKTPFDPEMELDGCFDVIDFSPEPSPEEAEVAWPDTSGEYV